MPEQAISDAKHIDVSEVMLSRRDQREAPSISSCRYGPVRVKQARVTADLARPRNVSRCASVDIGQPQSNGATPKPQMDIVLESSESKILTAFTFPAALSASNDVALTGSCRHKALRMPK